MGCNETIVTGPESPGSTRKLALQKGKRADFVLPSTGYLQPTSSPATLPNGGNGCANSQTKVRFNEDIKGLYIILGDGRSGATTDVIASPEIPVNGAAVTYKVTVFVGTLVNLNIGTAPQYFNDPSGAGTQTINSVVYSYASVDVTFHLDNDTSIEVPTNKYCKSNYVDLQPLLAGLGLGAGTRQVVIKCQATWTGDSYGIEALLGNFNTVPDTGVHFYTELASFNPAGTDLRKGAISFGVTGGAQKGPALAVGVAVNDTRTNPNVVVIGDSRLGRPRRLTGTGNDVMTAYIGDWTSLAVAFGGYGHNNIVYPQSSERLQDFQEPVTTFRSLALHHGDWLLCCLGYNSVGSDGASSGVPDFYRRLKKWTNDQGAYLCVATILPGTNSTNTAPLSNAATRRYVNGQIRADRTLCDSFVDPCKYVASLTAGSAVPDPEGDYWLVPDGIYTINGFTPVPGPWSGDGVHPTDECHTAMGHGCKYEFKTAMPLPTR